MAKKNLVFFIIILIVILVFLRPFSKLRELNMKNKALVEEIGNLKKINRDLEKEENALEKDITFVEKKAREKLGVVKKGEVPYKVMPEKK